MRRRKRYNPKPGRNVRLLNVSIDEDLYLRLNHICAVTKIPRWKVVESGIRMKLRRLLSNWPKEFFIMPPDHVVAALQQDKDDDEDGES